MGLRTPAGPVMQTAPSVAREALAGGDHGVVPVSANGEGQGQKNFRNRNSTGGRSRVCGGENATT